MRAVIFADADFSLRAADTPIFDAGWLRLFDYATYAGLRAGAAMPRWRHAIVTLPLFDFDILLDAVIDVATPYRRLIIFLRFSLIYIAAI